VVFRHGESRALDPQLHSHAFIFNATKAESSKRLIALETGEIFARARFLTEVYRNELASQVRRLGYAITPAVHGFELVGISPVLLARFAKRAEERNAAITAREIEVGRSLSANEIAVLVRETRSRKLKELSPDEVRQRQLAQVDANEVASLRRLRDATPVPPAPRPLGDVVERAKEHVFERRAVVPDFELMAEVIRGDYGHHTLDAVRAAVAHGRNDLLVVDGSVSTRESLDQERALIAAINRGVGAFSPLGSLPPAHRLSSEQSLAVESLLGSSDAVLVLRGKAGTGKTQSLATLIEGCAVAGFEVRCFAPSTQAVAILHRDGGGQQQHNCASAAHALANAATVQRLLVDPAMQADAEAKLLVVDEYGLLSSRELKQVVDLAHASNSRLLLVGDAAQHTSVEASPAARLIERESRVTVVEIKEVRRQQQNRDYLQAAQALASGDLCGGLTRLDKMGAILEFSDPAERRSQMVEDWYVAAQKNIGRNASTKAALMVAPTWTEIDALNQVARKKLRSEGKLRGSDHSITTLWDRNFTRSEKKNPERYMPGDWLVTHKRTKYFGRGEELLILSRDAERISVRDAQGKEFTVSPRQSGLAWRVCEPRALSVTAGDALRLRAVGHVSLPNGKTRRLANGSTVTACGLDAAGRVKLPDGSILASREFVHGYALTSHAAQGMTVDAVFIAHPVSREGLYVSATRGRESIRIYTSDRDGLLDASRLASEDRQSAMEFARALPEPQVASRLPGRYADSPERLRALWTASIQRSREFSLQCLACLRPFWGRQNKTVPKRDNPMQSQHARDLSN
jgi:thymidine kinase